MDAAGVPQFPPVRQAVGIAVEVRDGVGEPGIVARNARGDEAAGTMPAVGQPGAAGLVVGSAVLGSILGSMNSDE